MFDPIRDITDKTGQDIVKALRGVATAAAAEKPNGRVTSLDDTKLATGGTVEAVGNPMYVSDFTPYPDFNLTIPGWYVFARIASSNPTATAVSVTGAEGHSIHAGYVDVAVMFDVASVSKPVTVDWGTEEETIIFKATDLAIRNLDYRVTFYVYPVDSFVTWEYTAATDETFVADKFYYTKDESDNYTLATVTVGEAIPADTYYVHSKAIFEGMTRNVTYVCNTPIDCPTEFHLPVIEDETHGCWFEIRFRHTGDFSSTLIVPEGVKVAAEHTQPEKAGFNDVFLQYDSIAGVKAWRFLNTHSTIPA